MQIVVVSKPERQSFLRGPFFSNILPFIKTLLKVWVAMTCPGFVFVSFCRSLMELKMQQPQTNFRWTCPGKTSSDQLVGQWIFELLQGSKAIQKQKSHFTNQLQMHVSHEKKRPYFPWNTGCFIGILKMVHYIPIYPCSVIPYKT